MSTRFDAVGHVWQVPDPTILHMKAKVLVACTVHNQPRAAGDVVEVDENTLANLIRKGRLAPVEVSEPEGDDDADAKAAADAKVKADAEAKAKTDADKQAAAAAKAKAAADKKAVKAAVKSK